ncbi:MAG: hypothetical protein ACOCXV_02715 [Bacteroidota bacterium]
MKAKNAYGIFLLFILTLLTIFFQMEYVSKRYSVRIINPECPWCEEAVREDVLYIPISAALMRLFSPADPHFLADLLWMRSAYYFGEHALKDQEYPYLFHMIDLITDLSPSWEHPYLFGAVILPDEADAVDDGMYLIEKGLVHHPDMWELWFYKGYYLWKYFDDNIGASEALHKASLMPGAPLYLAKLSATLATKAGQKEIALRFLQESINNTTDLNLRRILLKKLQEVMNGE